MTLMLELSPETEARLRRKAERAGQRLPDYLLAVADAEAEEEEAGEEKAEVAEGSAADLFAGRIGRIKGSMEAYSQNCGQRFTDYLLSEAVLAKDWSQPEEDEAWKDL